MEDRLITLALNFLPDTFSGKDYHKIAKNTVKFDIESIGIDSNEEKYIGKKHIPMFSKVLSHQVFKLFNSSGNSQSISKEAIHQIYMYTGE
ncbi:MAG: hypothetical protein AAFY45_35250 [Bacteroidota bacterium]